VRLLVFLTLLITLSTASASEYTVDGMVVNTFGSTADQAVIFVHGGPGYNSRDFEVTTAEVLANRGFYVVTYDERGQGRSAPVEQTEYNYKAYSDDILKIITTLKITKPVIMGHSHGGPISIKFDELNPTIAKAVVLVSGPVNFWETMQSFYHNCSARYTAANQKELLANLNSNFAKVATAQKGSSELIEPVATLFQHGLFGCKLYSTQNPTEDAKRLIAIELANPAPMEQNSMPGFLLNEDYIYRDHFAHVQASKGKFFGIYGNEDGLFNPESREKIRTAMDEEGKQRFYLVPEASHSVYIDQQPTFLKIVEEIIRGL
jgi:proline iminopeptidase